MHSYPSPLARCETLIALGSISRLGEASGVFRRVTRIFSARLRVFEINCTSTYHVRGKSEWLLRSWVDLDNVGMGRRDYLRSVGFLVQCLFTLCLQFRGKKKLAKKARDFLALGKELGDVRSRQEWLIR